MKHQHFFANKDDEISSIAFRRFITGQPGDLHKASGMCDLLSFIYYARENADTELTKNKADKALENLVAKIKKDKGLLDVLDKSITALLSS